MGTEGGQGQGLAAAMTMTICRAGRQEKLPQGKPASGQVGEYPAPAQPSTALRSGLPGNTAEKPGPPRRSSCPEPGDGQEGGSAQAQAREAVKTVVGWLGSAGLWRACTSSGSRFQDRSCGLAPRLRGVPRSHDHDP